MISVHNSDRGANLVAKGELADNLLTRARGLLGHAPLAAGEGMLIRPCRSIHTFFMGFPIDAAFLDKDGRVVHLMPDMAPGRVSPHVFKAHSVLELPAGTLAATGTEVGDLHIIGR
jgi:uncharacterized membrane protein (UPF0127 family)